MSVGHPEYQLKQLRNMNLNTSKSPTLTIPQCINSKWKCLVNMITYTRVSSINPWFIRMTYVPLLLYTLNTLAEDHWKILLCLVTMLFNVLLSYFFPSDSHSRFSNWLTSDKILFTVFDKVFDKVHQFTGYCTVYLHPKCCWVRVRDNDEICS